MLCTRSYLAHIYIYNYSWLYVHQWIWLLWPSYLLWQFRSPQIPGPEWVPGGSRGSSEGGFWVKPLKSGDLDGSWTFFTLHEAWWHTPFFRLILIGEKSEDLDGSWLEGWFEMKRCQMIPGAAACRSRGEIGVPEGWTPLFREMPLKFHPNPSKIPAQETMWQPTRVGKRERESWERI